MRTFSSRSPWQRAYAAASSRGRRRSRFRCPHTYTTHLPERASERYPRSGYGCAVCDEKTRSVSPRSAVARPEISGSSTYDAAQRQPHGLQSRPACTKYRCAAAACSWALSPWPKSRRSDEPIWKRPMYWPFCASVCRRDSHRATASASWQYEPKTVQIAPVAAGARPASGRSVHRPWRVTQRPSW